MKLDLTFPVADEFGKTESEMQNGQMRKNDPLGKFLGREFARAMANDKTKIVKYLDWARDLSQGKVIDVDRADQDMIGEFVINNQNLQALVKGQILEALEKQKNGKP